MEACFWFHTLAISLSGERALTQYPLNMKLVVVKVELFPVHSQRHLGESRYRSYTFLASALDGGEWYRDPAVLYPG
jgi:hypothetical protein